MTGTWICWPSSSRSRRRSTSSSSNGSIKVSQLESVGPPWDWRESRQSLHFLDCDGDADLDVLVLARKRDPPLRACENDGAGAWLCSDEFRCLGTDLSSWRPSDFGELGEIEAVSVGSSSDGGLSLMVAHQSRVVLWTAGFCEPDDPCNQKGFCLQGQPRCECKAGHELQDCSRCEPNYYTASLDGRWTQNCKKCFGEGGHVCYGRGSCFDDVRAAKEPASSDFWISWGLDPRNDWAAALTAMGNGSCLCFEARRS